MPASSKVDGITTHLDNGRHDTPIQGIIIRDHYCQKWVIMLQVVHILYTFLKLPSLVVILYKVLISLIFQMFMFHVIPCESLIMYIYPLSCAIASIIMGQTYDPLRSYLRSYNGQLNTEGLQWMHIGESFPFPTFILPFKVIFFHPYNLLSPDPCSFHKLAPCGGGASTGSGALLLPHRMACVAFQRGRRCSQMARAGEVSPEGPLSCVSQMGGRGATVQISSQAHSGKPFQPRWRSAWD